MRIMTREEVLHLAALSRIKVIDTEADSFAKEFDSILGYVEAVKGIAQGEADPKVGALHNVFREDIPTTSPGAYTERLLDAAPKREGRYIKVKKILGGTQ